MNRNIFYIIGVIVVIVIVLKVLGLFYESPLLVNCAGRTIFVADAHRDDGKRFVARSDEKLTAFLELERVTRESLRFLNAE